MKLIIYLCLTPIFLNCAHIRAKRMREINRNYVFSFGDTSPSWPQGYQIEGKYNVNQGPRVVQRQINAKVEGGKLIGRHEVWTINGEGRWIKEKKSD